MARCLDGIRRYAREHGGWHLFSSPPTLIGAAESALTLHSMRGWKGDGILAATDGLGSVPLASESGDRLYFKSTAALAGGAIAGRHNLYAWDADDGQLTTIAPTSSTAPQTDLRLMMSRNGRYLVYTSMSSHDPRHAAGVTANRAAWPCRPAQRLGRRPLDGLFGTSSGGADHYNR